MFCLDAIWRLNVQNIQNKGQEKNLVNHSLSEQPSEDALVPNQTKDNHSTKGSYNPWNIMVSNGEYLIGVGSYDMTGPAAGVNMMGYANIYQTTAGVHFRLRARTFIVADEDSQGPRFAFVNLDSGMASQLVTIKLLERIKSRYRI
ncbi:hypothetical protein F8388_012475 [Cannabis sativa]|uniref:Neutral/alkaline non-lysosomal ceramidase N-terminal domain-containing protein n=1 Tax=Cannabis sativa TaxID=3483 RepID=A0A7J6H0M6_CANSA|nr:hypothetical protein F8388_012475 [Cannabis sativa]